MSNPIQGPITGLASISAVTQPASGAGAAPSADGSDFLSTLDTMMSQASGTRPTTRPRSRNCSRATARTCTPP